MQLRLVDASNEFQGTLVHRGGDKLEPCEAMTCEEEGSEILQTTFKIVPHWGQQKTLTFLRSRGSLPSPIANNNNKTDSNNANKSNDNTNDHKKLEQ